MKLPVLIIGAGGHTRVLIEALTKSHTTILGCLAKEVPSNWVSTIPFLGNDDVLFRYPPSSVMLVNGIGSISLPEFRREVFLRFKQKGYHFVTVLHPTAILASDVFLGEGAQVMAGAIIQPGSRLGENVIVNTGAVVDHDCNIGAHVHIAPGVVLSGEVSVGEGSHIGTGARVIQRIKIGAGTVVGAGAAVLNNVQSGSMVAGVPARTLRLSDQSNKVGR